MTAKNGQFTYRDSVEITKHYDEVIAMLKELCENKICNLTTVIERDRQTSEEARNLFKETNDAHLKLLNGETQRTKERNDEVKERDKLLVAKSELYPELSAMKDDIKKLNTFKDNAQGYASAKSVTFTQILAIVALLLSLLRFFGVGL